METVAQSRTKKQPKKPAIPGGRKLALAWAAVQKLLGPAYASPSPIGYPDRSEFAADFLGLRPELVSLATGKILALCLLEIRPLRIEIAKLRAEIEVLQSSRPKPFTVPPFTKSALFSAFDIVKPVRNWHRRRKTVV